MKSINSSCIESKITWYETSKIGPQECGILVGIYCIENELIPFPVRFLQNGQWKFIDGSSSGRPVFWAERSIPPEIYMRSPCK